MENSIILRYLTEQITRPQEITDHNKLFGSNHSWPQEINSSLLAIKDKQKAEIKIM